MATEKWRMVIGRTDVADWYAGWTAAELTAINEGLVPDSVIFHYIDRPSVFIQRYCDAMVDVNYEACLKHNVKVARGVPAGGGVIYAEPGIEPFLFIVWNIKHHPEIPARSDLFNLSMLGAGADIISTHYGYPIRFRPLNDMEIWDPSLIRWRKFMGTGTTGVGDAFGFAWFPTVYKPSEIMREVMTSPGDKFADKDLKEVMLRGWNLEEAGVYKGRAMPNRDEIMKEWIDTTLDTLKRAFNIEVEPGEFNDTELKYVDQFAKMFESEEFIFAKSATKKFAQIPSGTALGKATIKITAGPLIRVHLLREGDNIKDIMFTGTLHTTKADCLEELENEIRGCKIEEGIIRPKVEEMFNKGVVIGLMDAPRLLAVIMEACEASYKAPIA